MTSENNTADRPWFMGPLPGLVLMAGSAVLLLHDGILPFRILWRRYTWKKVDAVRATVEIPYRRITLKPGVGQRDPDFQRGQRSRLSVEHQAGKSTPPRPASETPPGTDASRVVKKRVLPRQIHSKYIKKGTLFPYKAKVWYVTLAYSYNHRGKVYTIHDDTAPFTFDNEQQAADYVRAHATRWPIKVWVDPDRPDRATAFLDYPNWLWIRLGGLALLAGLIWMLLAAATGRQESASATTESAPQDGPPETGPARGGGVSDPRRRPRPR